MQQGSLAFVDLAGNEQAFEGSSDAKTVKEGIEINLGLLCFKKVIIEFRKNSNSLLSYNENILTKSLKEYFQKDSKLILILPASQNWEKYSDTINTLKLTKSDKNQYI